jgi:MSHA pilin protein MshA
MKNAQNGFTLIELVMVIVILGVLAAVAVPKFIDLGTEAKKAALDGVAGAVTSASSINYGSRSVSTGYGSATSGLTCTAAATAIMQGGIPSGYTTLTSGTLVGSGTTNTCTITQTATGNTQAAYIIGI